MSFYVEINLDDFFVFVRETGKVIMDKLFIINRLIILYQMLYYLRGV